MISLITNQTNTGSVEMQVFFLTNRVNGLSKHLKIHSKDYASQRGLLKILDKRRRLLSYLLKQHPERYDLLVSTLGIRPLKPARSLTKTKS
uniref:ribosomal protein S15 n=1 Tax=Streptofilum capillatum TaxID=2058781 RepID=UPI00286C4110|nr:ribosomal protein S15 [Streptofilum capillatum]WKT08573.1 ribosomal protein S15 [Streptofilum capillatum]WKT08672.1 ribosomal protein S15 [Streptofilum sp. BC4-VF8pt]WKT08771.1 ribosomal protein S15 [Streptofilum sp. ZNP2-VF4pt]